MSVLVEPPRLEALLDALAHLEFPLNPQIYHNGGPTGLPATTVVEFPAYANWLPEIRRLLEASGFPAGSVETAGMLDSIHAGHAAAAS
ncbi:MAG TPA: hypothetical protein VKR61_07220 [Bryobacteraceae bacterium]|nr:hypothetical protein [Bryobacteraceae bacterium]